MLAKIKLLASIIGYNSQNHEFGSKDEEASSEKLRNLFPVTEIVKLTEEILEFKYDSKKVSLKHFINSQLNIIPKSK